MCGSRRFSEWEVALFKPIYFRWKVSICSSRCWSKKLERFLFCTLLMDRWTEFRQQDIALHHMQSHSKNDMIALLAD